MKRISNFEIFESNQWWIGKLSEYDIEKEKLISYFNYLTDEYEVSINIDTLFYNKSFVVLVRKDDLIGIDYYLGYNLTIVNSDKISNPNEFIKYHQYLINGLNSISKSYNVKIINHSANSTIIRLIDESQPLTKSDVVFKKRLPRGANSLIDAVNMKLERISKICQIIENSEFPQEDVIYLKERKGTTSERLEEILFKLFSEMISENIVKINKSSAKIRLNSRKEYEFIQRLDRSYPRTQNKPIFQITLI